MLSKSPPSRNRQHKADGICGIIRNGMAEEEEKQGHEVPGPEPKVSKLAMALTAFAWLWTAYECDTIGIDVFDMLLKRFPGQLWIMAAVLTWLTIIWMPRHLLTRAVMGIFMLIPAELFKVTRPILPESGFAPVQIVVGIAYVLAIIGMYGMFYPWRVEAVLKRVFRRR